MCQNKGIWKTNDLSAKYTQVEERLDEQLTVIVLGNGMLFHEMWFLFMEALYKNEELLHALLALVGQLLRE